ncbi:MAG: hypothetical protein LHV69_06430 [Elusimicrobia bacterium]|nr:hypothetical protein [Candidatus Obscuribacterium magneticum]
MITVRFALHPVLSQKKSRMIFFLFLIASIFIGGLYWYRFNQIILGTHIDRFQLYRSADFLLSFFLSIYVRLALIGIVAVIGTGLTCKHIIGPYRRIVEWLEQVENGARLPPLKVRKRDLMQSMVHLLNEVYNTIHKP